MSKTSKESTACYIIVILSQIAGYFWGLVTTALSAVSILSW